MITYITSGVFVFGIIGCGMGVLESIIYAENRTSLLTLTGELIKGVLGGFVMGSVIGGVFYIIFFKV